MMDSNMKSSFHMTSFLCSAGTIGLCWVWFGLLLSIIINRWYRCIILFLVFLFVFNQMFCLNGGGLILRFVSHVSDSSHL